MQQRALPWSFQLLVVAFVLLLPTAGQAAVFRWITASGSIGTATNWNPTRSAPALSDVLEFDGSLPGAASPVVTVDASISVRQLRFTNGVNATLFVTADRTITLLSGTSGTDFIVSPTSVVRFNSTSLNNELTVHLNSGTTGEIAGILIFSNTSVVAGQAHSNHRLTGPLNGITFLSGSTFKQEPGADGGAFGTSVLTANFVDGATFIQNSANSTTPLGASGDVVAFAIGSFYIFKAGIFADVGNTYGNLEFQGSAVVSSGTLTIRNNLKITSGTLTLGTSELTVSFTGIATQTISGAGFLAMGSGVTLDINNSEGVVLSRAMAGIAFLSLNSGILTTTATNLLTLAADATVEVNGPSFVNGPLARQLADTTPNTVLEFPIGSGSIYRPLTLTLTQDAVTTTTYTAQQLEGRPPTRTFSGDVQRVSALRYFTVASSGATTFTDGVISLAFGTDDQVDAAAKLRIARSSGATWVSLGGTTDPNTNGTTAFDGTVTSTVAFTDLGDFALASTSLGNGIGNNPLPVELTWFRAGWQGSRVQLQWLTASEQNSAHFVVQRSSDGRQFRDLGTLAGQGTSSQAHRYEFTDVAPLPELSYYRLRQVDLDGAATYSPVVAVRSSNQVAGVYPNPCAGLLTLPATNGQVTYRILNLQGQTQQNGQADSGSTLDVRPLPGGIYFLELTCVGKQSVQRFVRE